MKPVVDEKNTHTAKKATQRDISILHSLHVKLYIVHEETPNISQVYLVIIGSATVGCPAAAVCHLPHVGRIRSFTGRAAGSFALIDR